MRPLALGTLALLAAAAIGACSSSAGAPADAACKPGESRGCLAPTGCSGSQTCNADGTAYGACSCTLTPADASGGGGDGSFALDGSGGGGDASPDGGGGGEAGACAAATAACPAIPSRASVDACGACDQCAAASCCAAMTTCFTVSIDGGSGDCSQWIDCYAACKAINGGTGCTNGCDLSYPDALVRGQAARSCLLTSCTAQCGSKL
jgi:hypothetical protein